MPRNELLHRKHLYQQPLITLKTGQHEIVQRTGKSATAFKNGLSPQNKKLFSLPHAVSVTTAEVTDRKGALMALERCKLGLKRVCRVLCDSGYVGKPFEQGVRKILGQSVAVQIAKRNELHTFKVIPRR